MTAQIVTQGKREAYTPDVRPREAASYIAGFPGQLWERTRDHSSFLAAVLTETQWARMCAARNILGTRHDGNRQHDLVKPFTTDTMFNRAEAQGHLRRTGHQLTGFYVLQHGARGFYRLTRTCECAR